MITINEKLIVTKQINEVMCRYAKKVLLKDFLLKFSFQKNTLYRNQLQEDDINPLLVSLNYHEGFMYENFLLEVEKFISDYLNKTEENNLIALYFLTINENFANYVVDFENTDEVELIANQDDFDELLGRELAYKIYEPDATGLTEELEEQLKDYISTLAVEIDLSEIDEYSVENIIEAIEIMIR